MMDRDEPASELDQRSAERKILDELVRKGLIEWNGGKPKGLRGVVVRGEPVSETIIRARR